ncbi:hypothetical protein TSUD_191250 [Trifolium subterraneum]|uniref:RING-type E3 ubiquitin transferase n=1 Tax=Trifolium subterraneum TaxID=3900 RepID=A0A2Z6NNY0_TRISU|nr:hypothetical protein TSUD_191250 [Trifolium subterraneum]
MNDDVSLFEAYGMRRMDAPYMPAAQTHMRRFTGLTNNSPSMNLNLPLGRNELVYNTGENYNQNEAIRYISEMHPSLTSSLVNTRSSNEIFSITNTPSRMNYDDISLFEAYGMRRMDAPYIFEGVEQTMHPSLTSSLVNTRNANEILSITNTPSRMNYDDVSLSETYGMRRIDVPHMLAAEPHMRSFPPLTNNNAGINLNFSLGRNERLYNTGENYNQNEAIRYISDGVEQSMHSYLTSNLVNTRNLNEIFSITNTPSRMNDDVFPFEAYGMRRMDAPYMPAAQTHMRSFTNLANNSASMNQNLSLGRNEQFYSTGENYNQNEAIRYISDGVEQSMHSSLTSSLMNPRSVNEIFSITNGLLSMNDDVSLSGSTYGMRRNDVPYMPATQTHTRSFTRLANNGPSINLNLSLGLSSSTPTRVESDRRRTSPAITNARNNRESVGFMENQEARLNLPLKRTVTQREVGESSTSYFPYAPSARNSLSEYQHSSGSTSTAIQIGRNYEQIPHIQFRRNPELMREMMREMMVRIEEHRMHCINERGLTEGEIMKYINCANFEVPAEGTSEIQELCCICQEAFVIGEGIGKLDCAHIFHMNCITQWLSEKNICPLCKCRGLFVGDDDEIDLC